MKNRSVMQSVALIVVFVAVALLTFTDNVRTVQVLGLMACGAVIGASLKNIISAIRTK